MIFQNVTYHYTTNFLWDLLCNFQHQLSPFSIYSRNVKLLEIKLKLEFEEYKLSLYIVINKILHKIDEKYCTVKRYLYPNWLVHKYFTF